ncbi:MAG: SRPBCC family protein [Acidimicrobiales bacterium]
MSEQMTGRTVVISRELEAPPERVFAAWTDVELLTQWFGCATDMLWQVHSWDVKPGGLIHVSLDFDGTPYVVRGRFVDVDEPNRLQYEWEAGQVITVTIEAHSDGSRMTVEHAGLPNEEMEEIVTGGWSASTIQIKAVL